jgi:hypothetical protein
VALLLAWIPVAFFPSISLPGKQFFYFLAIGWWMW